MKGPLALTQLKGRPLWYRVRRSRRARRPGVEVTRRDGVVVVLPWRARDNIVPPLLEHWADWLAAKVDEYDVWQGPRIRQYASGSLVHIMGRPRRLKLKVLPPGERGFTAALDKEQLVLEMRPELIFEPRPVLERYLRLLARDHLTRRTEIWGERVGRHARRVIVGERVSRWGSCSPRGTLSFCYRLIMAPPHVIDGIVAHEVCHLKHLDHSHRFWGLLDEVCPHHRLGMAWLNEHEDDLIL